MSERYLDIVAAVDAEFRRNRELHSERIHCRSGCTDCCHHLFDITEMEAEHIARGVKLLDPPAREALLERARQHLEARKHLSVGARLACPALVDGVCSLYEYRPLMCHKFGMPLYNPERPDRIFACELNFKDGEEVADPHLIRIQTGIHQAWKQLQAEHASRETGPLNVALAIVRATAAGPAPMPPPAPAPADP